MQSDTEGRKGSVPGSIDYRLARRQLLRRVRSGEVATNDVCDAQRELMRVATNCGSRATAACPVCGESALRIVQFAFGPRLPAGGRVIDGRAQLVKLADRYGHTNDARTYTVEVCLDCRWNHLLDVMPLTESARGSSRRSAAPRRRART